MIDLLIGLVALVGVCLVVGAAIVCGLMLGADAYRGWREHQRESLRARDSVARVFYGPYRSPFPWHKQSHPRDAEKDGAA